MKNITISSKNERFHQTLEHYMGEVNYLKSKNPKILNIGCGLCYEAEVLVDFFGGSLLGVDNNKSAIKSLKRIYKKHDDYKFIHGDARNLNSILDEKVDIVVARHPDVCNDNWKKIFKESYKFTKKGGIIIATCHFYHEPKIVKKNLKKANYKVEVCEENVLPAIAEPRPTFSDMYVVIGKK